MPLIKGHLTDLEDSTIRKPSITEFDTSSKPAPLPALPQRSAQRDQLNRDNGGSPSHLSKPFLSTSQRQTTQDSESSQATTPDLSPSNSNPYDSYLSEEDASESADEDYDISTVAIAYHNGHKHNDSTEDIAKIVEFMFVGKPTVVDISVSRPNSAEESERRPKTAPRPSLPRRQGSLHRYESEFSPKFEQLPRRPRTGSIPLLSTDMKPTPSWYTHNQASQSMASLPFLQTEYHNYASTSCFPDSEEGVHPHSVSYNQSPTRFMAKELLKHRLESVTKGIGAAAARRKPSMGKINLQLQLKLGKKTTKDVVDAPMNDHDAPAPFREGKRRGGSMDLLRAAVTGGSTLTLNLSRDDHHAASVRREERRAEREREKEAERSGEPLRYEDIMRLAIHAPPPERFEREAVETARSPRLAKMKSGMMLGMGRRKSFKA